MTLQELKDRAQHATELAANLESLQNAKADTLSHDRASMSQWSTGEQLLKKALLTAVIRRGLDMLIAEYDAELRGILEKPGECA